MARGRMGPYLGQAVPREQRQLWLDIFSQRHDGLRLRSTLVADGPSDRALLHVIQWVLRQRPLRPYVAFELQYFDPRPLDDPPADLRSKITRRWSSSRATCSSCTVTPKPQRARTA